MIFFLCPVQSLIWHDHSSIHGNGIQEFNQTNITFINHFVYTNWNWRYHYNQPSRFHFRDLENNKPTKTITRKVSTSNSYVSTNHYHLQNHPKTTRTTRYIRSFNHVQHDYRQSFHPYIIFHEEGTNIQLSIFATNYIKLNDPTQQNIQKHQSQLLWQVSVIHCPIQLHTYHSLHLLGDLDRATSFISCCFAFPDQITPGSILAISHRYLIHYISPYCLQHHQLISPILTWSILPKCTDGSVLVRRWPYI